MPFGLSRHLQYAGAIAPILPTARLQFGPYSGNRKAPVSCFPQLRRPHASGRDRTCPSLQAHKIQDALGVGSTKAKRLLGAMVSEDLIATEDASNQTVYVLP